MKFLFNYKRRPTNDVKAGNVLIGSNYPIRIQSMTSTSTLDTDGSVAQAIRMCDAGAELVRLTAQGVREAENIGIIRKILHSKGYDVPLVADIHFNPRAAFAAAEVTDKVRINPGNFVDAARTFKKLSYTDHEYAQEIEKIREAVIPFINICKEHHTAVRLGVNHGSLSDRIMSRYGDTPAGMVESAMEFLRIFVAEDFKDVVISIKASNTVVMVQTVRLLVDAMDKENMHFPLHLGVTEAGDGEDGRIKSAVGIGTLLSEGIGDTIRVSLSEEPEMELPVARKLIDYIIAHQNAPKIEGEIYSNYNYLNPDRRKSNAVLNVGGMNKPIVIASCMPHQSNNALKPDFFFSENGVMNDTDNYIVPIEKYKGLPNSTPLFHANQLSALKDSKSRIKWLLVDANIGIDFDILRSDSSIIVVLFTTHENISGSIQAFMHRLMGENILNPVVIKHRYSDIDSETIQVKAGADFGTLLMNGFRDGLWIEAPQYPNKEDIVRYEFGILQAARLRTSKTEFISCPGCGRTLFDLQTTVRRVKEATSHLTHLKIGIMGCIVNGPGEMADADYGYVGAAAGKISLYKGKKCMEMNIPQEDAIPHLIALIKDNGDWIEPANK